GFLHPALLVLLDPLRGRAGPVEDGLGLGTLLEVVEARALRVRHTYERPVGDVRDDRQPEHDREDPSHRGKGSTGAGGGTRTAPRAAKARGCAVARIRHRRPSVSGANLSRLGSAPGGSGPPSLPGLDSPPPARGCCRGCRAALVPDASATSCPGSTDAS